MNRDKQEIKTKINELKETANKLGLIDFEVSTIYENRQHCLWYGGEIARFYYDHYLVTIEVAGDVYATLNDEHGEYITHTKDKGNNGNFFYNMRDYIPDDETLESYLNNGYYEIDKDDKEARLEIENNNWIEFNVYNRVTEQWIDMSLYNVLDDSDDVLDIDLVEMINTVNELIEEEKKQGCYE